MKLKPKHMKLLTGIIVFIVIASIVLVPVHQVAAVSLNSLKVMIAPTPPSLTSAQVAFFISPAQVIKEMGDEFMVEVKITTRTPTRSAGFKLSWLRSDNSASLICTGIKKGSFYQDGTISGYTMPQASDNSTGGERFVVELPGGQEREAGTGTLAIVHFKVRSGGTFNGVYNLDLFDCQTNGDDISDSNSTDGLVLVGSAGTLEISPAEITVNEGGEFSTFIKLTTNKPIDAAAFQLSWEEIDGTSHLTCTKIEKGNFFPGGTQLGGGISDSRTTSPFAVSVPLGGADEPAKTGTLAVAYFSARVQSVYALHLYDCWAANDGEYFPLVSKDGLVTVTKPRPPIAPSNLRATKTGYAEIALAWQDNSVNETNFLVTRADNAEFTKGKIDVHETSGPNITSFIDYTVTKGKTYYYYVIAENEHGQSAPSNVLEVSTWPALPPAPINLTGNSHVDDSSKKVYVKLLWDDKAPNETGYRIERASDEDFTKGVRKFWLSADIKTYSDFTVQNNEVYFYRVFAYNNEGDSLPTNTLRVMTMPGIPNAPSELNVDKATGKEVTLVWKDNASDEIGFIIQRSPTSTFDSRVFSSIKVAVDNLQMYVDDKITDGKTYYYRVLAYNKQGESSPSNIVSVVIPARPTDLKIEVVNYTQVNLSWKDNEKAETGYRVERSLNLGFTRESTSYYLGPNIAHFSDIDTSPNTTYYYRVFTVNKDSEYFITESPPSVVVATTTGTPPDQKSMKTNRIDITSFVDDNGITQKRLAITTLQGIKMLEIDDDTQCLTGDDEPLLSIEVREVKSDTLALLKHRIIALPVVIFKTNSNSPFSPISVTREHVAQIIGPVVDLQPSGAKFSKPISIVLEYDESNYPVERAQSDLVLAYYDAHADKWVELTSKANPMGRTMKADITHFSTIGVIRKAESVTEWRNVIAIIAVEMVIALILLIILITKRRNN